MTTPHPLPAAGLPIPVRASFTVFKHFPPLAIANNNLAPLLTLFEDGLEHRVMTTAATGIPTSNKSMLDKISPRRI